MSRQDARHDLTSCGSCTAAAFFMSHDSQQHTSSIPSAGMLHHKSRDRRLHDLLSICIAADEVLGSKQQRKSRRAGHCAPHIHVWRCEIVEHTRRLIGVCWADRHIQDAPCNRVQTLSSAHDMHKHTYYWQCLEWYDYDLHPTWPASQLCCLETMLQE